MITSTKYFRLGILLLLCLYSEPSYSDNAQSAKTRLVRNFLSSIYPNDYPGASVIVRQYGKTLLREGRGLAKTTNRTPITPETEISIGSITKQFTAADILILSQRGFLSTHDDVGLYLPSLAGRGITLDHLLTHTSGIKNFIEMPQYKKWSRSGATKSEMLAAISREPQEFMPGARWSYCDSGYFLLGLIIEKVSGQSFEIFTDSNIFKPLRMNRSYILPNSNSRLASGHIWSGNAFSKAPPFHMEIAYAAGAMVTTVDDLARWDEALRNSTIFSPATLSLMFTPHRLNDGTQTIYGYAWFVHEFEGELIEEHGGRISGFECHILRIPKKQLFVAVLTNSLNREPSPDFVATRIATEILGRPYNPIPKSISEQTRKAVVGTYDTAGGTPRCVVSYGDHLFTIKKGGRLREILATSELVFFYPLTFNTVRFKKDSEGRVSEMALSTKYKPDSFFHKVSDATEACNP